jgi:RND family efflux transporter MFP subunit
MLLDAGAMSQQEFEQAETQLKTAEAQLKSIEDQIRQQQSELAYYHVVAQASGVIGDVPVRVGDRVTQSTVLTTIEDNEALEAYISVPVQLAPGLQLGLPVRIMDDSGETLVSTKISFVSPSVDDATQSVLVKAPVDTRGVVLRSDQFVRTEIVWSTESQLTLPVIATQRISNHYFVFVAEEAEGGLAARQRSVTLGPVVGDSYVVLGGLDAGDRLILAGTQKIGDGAPVQELPAAPPPAEGGAGVPDQGRGGL